MQQGGVFNVDGYEALESIGSGSFGLIRKVRRKADGKVRIPCSLLPPRIFVRSVYTSQGTPTTGYGINFLLVS